MEAGDSRHEPLERKINEQGPCHSEILTPVEILFFKEKKREPNAELTFDWSNRQWRGIRAVDGAPLRSALKWIWSTEASTCYPFSKHNDRPVELFFLEIFSVFHSLPLQLQNTTCHLSVPSYSQRFKQLLHSSLSPRESIGFGGSAKTAFEYSINLLWRHFYSNLTTLVKRNPCLEMKSAHARYPYAVSMQLCGDVAGSACGLKTQGWWVRILHFSQWKHYRRGTQQEFPHLNLHFRRSSQLWLVLLPSPEWSMQLNAVHFCTVSSKHQCNSMLFINNIGRTFHAIIPIPTSRELGGWRGRGNALLTMEPNSPFLEWSISHNVDLCIYRSISHIAISLRSWIV